MRGTATTYRDTTRTILQMLAIIGTHGGSDVMIPRNKKARTGRA